MRLGFKDFVWLIIFSAIIDWKEIKKIRRPIGRGKDSKRLFIHLWFPKTFHATRAPLVSAKAFELSSKHSHTLWVLL